MHLTFTVAATTEIKACARRGYYWLYMTEWTNEPLGERDITATIGVYVDDLASAQRLLEQVQALVATLHAREGARDAPLPQQPQEAPETVCHEPVAPSHVTDRISPAPTTEESIYGMESTQRAQQ